MAVPALRQPKLANKLQGRSKPSPLRVQNVILTLKDDRKLVLPSDNYHGIITTKEMFKCLFCGTDMELDVNYKEFHKDMKTHKQNVRSYPHVDDYGENLIRKVNRDLYYCTICNAVISAHFISRHISSETHGQELNMAVTRGATYKPA